MARAFLMATRSALVKSSLNSSRVTRVTMVGTL
jgi:hypothetical protein